MSADLPPSAVGHLPPALRDPTERLLARFSEACAGAGCVLPAEKALDLARVFTASPFVAEVAIGMPDAWLEALEAPPGSRNATAYAALTAALFEAGATEEVLRARARRFRQVELARSAWFDVLGLSSLEQVLAEISALADALVDAAATWLNADLVARYGTPADTAGAPVNLVVVALGKLGGSELNFSSDIDLMFTFRAGGETQGARRALSNQEFFDRLGKRLIAFLNDVTPEGFIYRVDMRLRPFGDSGALTASFAALEQYYLLHGRDWERYALIKARVIHGSRDDAILLDDIIRPFVYRRYLDFGAVEAVRQMKAMIDAEIARDGLADDLKRGAGGIREIEFIAQAFQLVRGGRERRLRSVSLLPTLSLCGELGLLAPEDVTALRLAYFALRTAEHRLQQVRDAQTQLLPRDELERARFAHALGARDWTSIAATLSDHRAAVRERFRALLLPAEGAPPQREAQAGIAHELWSYAPADPRTVPALAQLGFNAPEEAASVLDGLREPRFLNRLSLEARQRLDRLMPRLLDECARWPAGTQALTRLADLLRAVARRSVYLALLADHRLALARLVDLCLQSSWAARQITHWPILLDELLDDRLLQRPLARRELTSVLNAALETVDAGDLDRQMEVLRNFKHQQVLRVAACDLMTDHTLAEISNHLTWIAEALVEKALAMAWRDLVSRHGRPRTQRAGRTRVAGFAVIAYGKLGGRELGYSSDLDLVFVHDGSGERGQTDGPRPVANAVFFTRLAQRLIHLLTTPTPAGQAYELDIRLRPSGSSGLLVTSLEALREYQLHQAWTWEHQALIRARGVAGDPELQAGFARVRREVLATAREPGRLRRDIVEMREKMRAQLDRSDAEWFDLKQGVGGITDIEFMVQYACLRWSLRHPSLTAFTDNLRLLDLIGDLALLPREDCRLLHEAYFAYRAEVHRCALQEVDGLISHSALCALRESVTAIWRRLMNDENFA